MLIQQRLEDARAAVQDLYEQYQAVRDTTEDYVNQELLAARIDRLQDLSILLVVAGEVKSGKSSFVNAFLGTELLPVNTLQSSSAVVEITHGTHFLHVTYADGSTQEVGEDVEDWEHEVRDTLAQVAAVPDAYRDLPVVHLRQFVADHQPEGYSDVEFQALVEDLSEEPSTNPRRLSSSEFKDRASAFLAGLGAPSQVATEIQLRHPLPHGSAVVRVVDTPGVNAIGGVESVTRSYIHNADALLFIQSLATSVESQSFRAFVDENVKDRLKAALFLIYTHASRLNTDDKKDRLVEAQRIYGATVGSPDRILPVDSVLKQVCDDAAEAASVESLIGRYKEERKDDGARGTLAKEKFALLAPLALEEDDFACLRDTLDDESGFRAVHQAIAEYAGDAPYIQIAEILDEIARGLNNLQGHHEDEHVIHAEGAKGVEALRHELSQRREEIQRLRGLLATEETVITVEFTDPDSGVVPRDAAEKKSGWRSRLDGADNESVMRTIALSAQDDADRLRTKWARALSKRCQKALLEEAQRVHIPELDVLPSIDIDAIAEKERADSTTEVTEGTLFKNTKHQFDDEKFKRALRTHLKKEVSRRADGYRDHFANQTLPSVVTQVSSSLKDVFERKEGEYEEREADHQSAEQHAAAATHHRQKLANASALLKEVAGFRASVYREAHA